MELLRNSEKRTTSVQWPTEVDAYLNLLQRLVATEGVQISRSQLLAALVADMQLDGRHLARVARAYLRRRTGELDGAASSLEELPALSRPGRRSRNSDPI